MEKHEKVASFPCRGRKTCGFIFGITLPDLKYDQKPGGVSRISHNALDRIMYLRFFRHFVWSFKVVLKITLMLTLKQVDVQPEYKAGVDFHLNLGQASTGS